MSSKAPAGLTYVHDDAPGITRRRSGKGFTYRAKGRAVRDKKTLERIAKLAIPPAWEDVWISAKENGHLQATGRDARGRKQSRYHPRFREHQESAKFDHLADFAKALPAIRKTINAHMRKQGLPREKCSPPSSAYWTPRSSASATTNTHATTKATASRR